MTAGNQPHLWALGSWSANIVRHSQEALAWHMQWQQDCPLTSGVYKLCSCMPSLHAAAAAGVAHKTYPLTLGAHGCCSRRRPRTSRNTSARSKCTLSEQAKPTALATADKAAGSLMLCCSCRHTTRRTLECKHATHRQQPTMATTKPQPD